MTWPTALPVAALRVLRTAAGRRALQLVLLVAGLSALGFLCDGQAHAVEGAPAPTVLIAEVSGPAQTVGSTDAVTTVRSVSEQTGRASIRLRTPVRTEERVRTEGRVRVERLVRAEGLVRPSAEGADGTVVDVSSPTPSAPSLPAADGRGPVARGAARVRTGEAPAAVAAADGSAYGPAGSVAGGPSRATHRAGPARNGPPADPSPTSTPAHQGPTGDPAGGPASDSGVARHGDAHAVVTPCHRQVLWQALGAAADSDVVETQDRYRDVPVFPG
ncbi:hypothetical protein ACN6K4_000062 [Streptomyces hayashii]|uniref:hypothetical protein n=1 Tax=Streptomyces TaxID=1883 RepID=UPI002FF01F20